MASVDDKITLPLPLPNFTVTLLVKGCPCDCRSCCSSAAIQYLNNFVLLVCDSDRPLVASFRKQQTLCILRFKLSPRKILPFGFISLASSIWLCGGLFLL